MAGPTDYPRRHRPAARCRSVPDPTPTMMKCLRGPTRQIFKSGLSRNPTQRARGRGQFLTRVLNTTPPACRHWQLDVRKRIPNLTVPPESNDAVDCAYSSAVVAPEPIRCPRCGSVNRRPLWAGGRGGRSVKDRCDDCGSVWVAPSHEQLARSAISEFDRRLHRLADEAASLRDELGD